LNCSIASDLIVFDQKDCYYNYDAEHDLLATAKLLVSTWY